MITKIIKINILSLLALPLLLIATISELAARALEKIPLILRMLCISAVTVALADTIQNNTGLAASTEFAIFIGICAVIVTIALWVLSIFSSVLDVAWHMITLLFNAVYDITYRCFLFLNESCEREYALLSLKGFHSGSAVFCIFYTLLHGTDWMIIHLLWMSRALSVAAGAATAFFVLIKRSDELLSLHGMTLAAYLRSQEPAVVLYECVLLLAVILPVTIVLLSLGREWHDWAIELRMDSMQCAEYVDSIQDSDVSFIDNIERPDEDAIEMQDILNDHTGTIDQLCEEVEDTLYIKNDVLLRNRWNEYLCDLYGLIDEIENIYHNEIPHREFKKMIYQVQRLERKRNELFNYIDDIMALAQNPAYYSTFFSGCTSRTQLDKRYKELCKAYHPDSVGGDQDTFISMQQEYKKLKNEFRN